MFTWEVTLRDFIDLFDRFFLPFHAAARKFRRYRLSLSFRLMVACLRRKVERTSVLSPVPFQGPKRFFFDFVRGRRTSVVESTRLKSAVALDDAREKHFICSTLIAINCINFINSQRHRESEYFCATYCSRILKRERWKNCEERERYKFKPLFLRNNVAPFLRTANDNALIVFAISA